MAKQLMIATLLGGSALTFAACDSTPDEHADPGSLRMGLVGQDNQGNVYRLRDGVFDIDGPEMASLSTEDSPTPLDSLTIELTAGDYGIFLNDGWRLERWDPMTDETLDVGATLTSANPASALITGTETSTVVFNFFVDDAGPVVLGDGDLVIDIDIDVEDPTPPAPAACNPLDPLCPASEACYPYDTPTQFGCFPVAIEGQLYETCEFINGCASGLVCAGPFANDNCTSSDSACCLALCDTQAPACADGETCLPFDGDNPGVGVCGTAI